MRRLAPVVLLALAACQATAVSHATMELSEFTISPSESTFEAGEVEVTVRNEGGFGHTLVVTDSDQKAVMAGDVLAPSEEATIQLDLPPGKYEFTCRIVSQSGSDEIVDHYEQGMLATVVVEET